MADEAKGTEGEQEPASGDAFGLDWSVQMKEVQRIEPDPEDEDPLENLFSVTFAVDGPNADGSLEIMVCDAADVEVVAVALDTLHGALLAWADLIQRRKEQLRAIAVEG